ncbi:MAG TPA: aminodeoxychorismate/anthranilate synthase component II [Planctomycetota bacterium]|nr:aminodeoxychorismate/anthranilate synthase component II [Planctomycetota bacterium]
MLLVIDNYDSFTYNLVQCLGQLGADMKIVRNDEITVDELAALKPDLLLISPGPCSPSEAGISVAAIKRMAGRCPILGVCLGHQAIGEAFGGQVIRAGRLMHGKTSPISHDGKGLFSGVPSPFQATRYHSLVVAEPLPDCLVATAWSDQKELMGVRHKTLQVEGVQFHPESFLSTNGGPKILQNFLALQKGVAV